VSTGLVGSVKVASACDTRNKKSEGDDENKTGDVPVVHGHQRLLRGYIYIHGWIGRFEKSTSQYWKPRPREITTQGIDRAFPETKMASTASAAAGESSYKKEEVVEEGRALDLVGTPCPSRFTADVVYVRDHPSTTSDRVIVWGEPRPAAMLPQDLAEGDDVPVGTPWRPAHSSSSSGSAASRVATSSSSSDSSSSSAPVAATSTSSSSSSPSESSVGASSKPDTSAFAGAVVQSLSGVAIDLEAGDWVCGFAKEGEETPVLRATDVPHDKWVLLRSDKNTTTLFQAISSLHGGGLILRAPQEWKSTRPLTGASATVAGVVGEIRSGGVLPVRFPPGWKWMDTPCMGVDSLPHMKTMDPITVSAFDGWRGRCFRKYFDLKGQLVFGADEDLTCEISTSTVPFHGVADAIKNTLAYATRLVRIRIMDEIFIGEVQQLEKCPSHTDRRAWWMELYWREDKCGKLGGALCEKARDRTWSVLSTRCARDAAGELVGVDRDDFFAVTSPTQLYSMAVRCTRAADPPALVATATH
jgi:hypothetical protein